MQNVGAAALFLPVVSRISARSGLPMSRLLMPMGFGLLSFRFLVAGWHVLKGQDEDMEYHHQMAGKNSPVEKPVEDGDQA